MQPEKLGPFQIGRVLGRGGMGAVYEGIHEDSGEAAAVKVLLANLEDDEELRWRFEAEIETLKRLRHPNIVRLFGFGEEQGMLYYVMEMVDGPSLYQEIKRKRLFQWHEVAKIGLEMCLALKHGHDRGITHRDIKPANILLERHGSIKLSDYGIAHFFGGQRLTEVNSVVGTLEYMSPEQALAHPVGPRSDLYSMGAVLYVLLVGKPPFSARNLSEILRKHQRNIIESIRSIRLDVPDEMEQIVFDLLKIKPEDRPQNAYLVAKRFQSLLQALVGPPEKIIVRPMDQDGPTTIALEPVRIPYKGDVPGEPEIDVHPRGVVVEDGLIDLGGLVDDPPDMNAIADDGPDYDATKTQELPPACPPEPPDGKTPINEAHPTPVWFEKKVETSFAVSFGRPGDDLGRTVQRTVDTVSLNPISKPDPQESPQPEEATTRIPKKPEITIRAGRELDATPIRHGEVLADEIPELRRSKDEPVPDLEIYQPIKTDDPGETPTVDTNSVPPPEIGDSIQNDVTRDNLDPPQPVERPSERDDASIPYGLQAPIPSPENVKQGATRIGVGEKDATTLPRSAESRFVSVLDEGFNDYEDDARSKRPVLSIQTVLASLCLILIGFTAWYLLQPVPPETLFGRIKSSVDARDTDEDMLMGLRRVKNEIDRFLSDYPNHAKADIVRFYKTELELAELDRKLERRLQVHDPKTLSPVERAYMEAISTAKNDPELSIRKLNALIDVFQTEFSASVSQKDLAEHGNVSGSRRQRLSSPVELCVDAAKRRLQRLEKDIQTINADQVGILRLRMEEAESLAPRDPVRAAAIWRGIIELYDNRAWAKEIVEESRAALAEMDVGE